MKWFGVSQASATYVDTERGIFTDSLIWFRTREAWLRDYAGAVFERRSLSLLLGDAAVWVRSPQTLTVWLLPFLLFYLSLLQAILVSLLVFVAWHTMGPALVSRALVPTFRFLETIMLQALAYVGTLSVFAAADRYAAVMVGLVGFILLRWGLLHTILRPVLRILRVPLYRIPVPDYVLRALIVRTALHFRITLADFAPIERSILQHIKKKK